MNILNHPVFQSVVLPLLLILALNGLWRVTIPRLQMLTPALAVVLTLAFWPGLNWPMTSRLHTLPWLAVCAFVLATVLVVFKLPGSKPWSARTGVLACALVALIGLSMVAWGGLGGSLMLAQFAAMLTTIAIAAAWPAWRQQAMSWAGLLPMIVFAAGVGLSLAWFLGVDPSALNADDPYFIPQWD